MVHVWETFEMTFTTLNCCLSRVSNGTTDISLIYHYLAVTAYISISVASLSRSNWQKNNKKNCPKPRANLVSDVRQMTQFFLFLGSFPLSKTGMQGKTVSDRHSERKTNKQQHCLTLSSDTNNLITACVTQRKYKRITILFFDFMTPWNGWCSYDSSGFRPV